MIAGKSELRKSIIERLRDFFVSTGIVLMIILVSGCASGPKYIPEFPKIEKSLKLKYKTVVVSRFYLTSYYRTEMMTSSYVSSGYEYQTWQIDVKQGDKDISRVVVEELKKSGINARAVKDIERGQLGPDEILLTGVVGTTGITEFPISRVFPFFILVGNCLPNPFGFQTGAKVNYRYEIIDAKNNILHQSLDNKVDVIYTDLWVWGFLANRASSYDKAKKDVAAKVFAEIAQVLR